MTLSRKSLLPGAVSDLLAGNGIFGPSTLDFESTFADWGLKRVPSVNIAESGREYKIELAAPGLEKNDFNVEVENGTLTISAEKETEKKEEDKNYRRHEFIYNSFSRSFNLPENALPEKIDAKYENGILILTLPKKEVKEASPKKKIAVL